MLAASEVTRPDTSGFYLQLFYVFVVLAIIVSVIILLIRFLGRKNQSWMRGRSIRTLGALGVGPNKSVQLIEVGDNIYLIGVGEDLSLLDKITDPDEVIRLKAAIQQEQNPTGTLPPFISNLTAKFRKNQPPEDIELEDTSSFHEVFESKLRSVPNRKQKVEELLREDQKDS
ncbi:flagellar biosynthetic protein FliO [Paenibacillus lemnae]|uniref:Flagellar protein n=1 Tax=Paenibacillus lemnae TaxID=1330551 RepID=A0A848M7C8_PAELE|nr:flagellar biosynthetic protein FliO [Paenibacillus lemnae]NMO96169.1 flagellar protein [Paenibacillus lemnae]